MSVDTSVRLPGMPVKNPVMTASGTFGYGLEFSPYGDLRALGGTAVCGPYEDGWRVFVSVPKKRWTMESRD